MSIYTSAYARMRAVVYVNAVIEIYIPVVALIASLALQGKGKECGDESRDYCYLLNL